MPKLSSLNLDTTRFKGKGYRPWTDHTTESSKKEELKPNHKEIKTPRKTGSKPGANQGQTGSKLGANREQIGSKLGALSGANGEQTGSATGSTIGSKPGANWEQTLSYCSLVGLQKKIVNLIHNECLNNRSRSSPKISLEYLSSILTTRKDTIKDAIKRLERKSLIIRKSYKPGRGGWSQYEIPEIVYSEILREEKERNREQIGSKSGAQPGAQPGASLPSSSSDYKKTTTTSAEQGCLILEQLEPQWNLDIASLEKIGFTQNHLVQIAKRKSLEAHLVQESIYAFAHDLENNAVQINSSPLNFFMGILNKSQPYVSRSAQYETPKEKAMRLFLEREARLKQQTQEIEMTLMQKMRSEWFSKMSFEEQATKAKEVHPQLETGKEAPASYRPSQMIATLEKYFEFFVWPEIKQATYEKEGFSDLLA